MDRGKTGEVYNVGSGSSIVMKDLLALLLKEAGLDFKIVEVTTLPVPGKTDIPEIYADIKKIKGL